MLNKSIIGLVFGLMLAMSLFVNVGYFVPLQRDVLLFSGYVGIFFVWAGLMTWFYTASKVTPPLKVAVPLFIVSTLANGLYYSGMFE